MEAPISTEPIYCPGLFEPASSGDGFLVRIRTPGGLVNYPQAEAIADLTGAGDSNLLVTNRGNLQISAAQAPSAALLQQLQTLGLAAKLPQLDRFRNIMASPTAGIDPSAVMDTRDLVRSIDRYISSQPHLAQLSAKFSIGIDGGEKVSIRQRPNDLCLVATVEGLRLLLRTPDGQWDTSLVWEQGVDAVQAIAHWYLQRSQDSIATDAPDPQRRSQRPRLRQFLIAEDLKDLLQVCIKAGARPVASLLPEAPIDYDHLGIHAQRQIGLSYVGISLPLGELTVEQWRGLSSIAQQYGSGQLHLSPWQNVILPDIAQVDQMLKALADLGLSADALDPAGWIAACRGFSCSSGETDSPQHARRLIQSASQLVHRPLQIHISGCSKGCAHPLSSDIALLGRDDGYEIYLPVAVGAFPEEQETSQNENRIFGYLLYPWQPSDRALNQVEELLRAYSPFSATMSFQEFIRSHQSLSSAPLCASKAARLIDYG
jgi:ferredoxin-nitrite reductase